MISIDLVFRNEEGIVVPAVHINSLDPSEFYQQWANGELRRDVAVTIEDEVTIRRSLQDFKSSEFQLVGAEVFGAWRDLDRNLSLTNHCLAHWTDHSGGHAVGPKVHDSHDPVIAPEVMEVKRDEFKIQYYTTYYWLTASVLHDAVWYARDPKVVVYDIVMELLNQWTMRDNATLLYLLKQADTINKPEAYKLFTPHALANMITQVSRWAIPVSHFIATAEVLAELSDPDWERFMISVGVWEKKGSFIRDPKWVNTGTGESPGRLMDLTTLCIGSRHDAFYPFLKDDSSWSDMYALGMPASLGIRAIHTEPQGKAAKATVLDVAQQGWLWSTYIGTAVLNSRAVATALVG